MVTLRELSLNACRITGLSDDFGNLINLRTLRLSANEFEGPIPSVITGLRNLGA